MKCWYLIHTKPRQERQAKEQLERQGYATYLPLAPIHRKRRGRTARVIDPMFPRYLFIHLSDKTDDWRPIRSTIGVSTLVRFGELPAKIPNELISGLHQREDAEGIQILPTRDYREGEKVLIAEGPLEGFEGIFLSRTGRERVTLLLKFAENYARLELDPAKIEPL